MHNRAAVSKRRALSVADFLLLGGVPASCLAVRAATGAPMALTVETHCLTLMLAGGAKSAGSCVPLWLPVIEVSE